jgi:hypothetical protein
MSLLFIFDLFIVSPFLFQTYIQSKEDHFGLGIGSVVHAQGNVPVIAGITWIAVGVDLGIKAFVFGDRDQVVPGYIDHDRAQAKFGNDGGVDLIRKGDRFES